MEDKNITITAIADKWLTMQWLKGKMTEEKKQAVLEFAEFVDKLIEGDDES
jgi:hypothetical protein